MCACVCFPHNHLPCDTSKTVQWTVQKGQKRQIHWMQHSIHYWFFFHCNLFPVSLQRKPVDYLLALSICHDSIPSCVWNKRDRKIADVTNAKKSFKRRGFTLSSFDHTFLFSSVDFTMQWCNREGKKFNLFFFFFFCTEWVVVWWILREVEGWKVTSRCIIGDDIVMLQL